MQSHLSWLLYYRQSGLQKPVVSDNGGANLRRARPSGRSTQHGFIARFFAGFDRCWAEGPIPNASGPELSVTAFGKVDTKANCQLDSCASLLSG